ncbi:N-acetylmuramoyl-L-alanine amidase [Ornithinibacillus sp. L9]|uniref:N-acetylmuramoyl-L-alanine amidase n=1 Tax=Ornithinibacillus caprae TaxID=2678566 RepID=A0A6N8FHP7_9BACI|nr:N-acetylmuramoyl-L-alanine amidase [Ornithinibacillus caprae]MUK88216.1 N-acetylmuramoyl-L-alanine amidase [Ornithinibacillus caprae]
MQNKLYKVAVIFLIMLICSACNSAENDNTNNNVPEDDSSLVDSTYKVVLDPGHGGKDVGATGVSGQYEKSFTLSLSMKVKELLEQETDIEVYMTRSDDSYISQESRYRPTFANDLNADVFISIHGNTFTDSNVSGTETFYYHKSSLSFAKIVHEHVAEATGFKDRGVKREAYFVVKDTEMPAVLLEIGYLTNPIDEQEMLTESFQNRVAAAIVEGIIKYKLES